MARGAYRPLHRVEDSQSRIEQPDAPDFNHIVLPREVRWKFTVWRVQLRDAHDRVVDLTHAARAVYQDILEAPIAAYRHGDDRVLAGVESGRRAIVVGAVAFDLPAPAVDIHFERHIAL